AQTTGYIPSNTKALENDDFKKAVDGDSCYRTAVDQLPHVTGPFTFPGPNAQKISNTLRDRLREVVTQKRPPTEVMPDMIRDAAALLPGS
ncbi:MAG: ABC transporter substrate-binding protein, partial [Alphaproteobacteria bacterium]|nr:ABC transporter substrate-binding protein [Alphaproteobacteria bacterium]